MSVKIIEPNVESYFVKTPLTYVDTAGLTPLLKTLMFKRNVILSGEKGIGKSLAISALAYETEVPLIIHWCTENDRRESLVGHLTLVNGETVYNLGPLPRAIAIANKAKRAILHFEEVNALTPQTQKLINPLTDWHREVETDYGFYRLDEGAEIWVTGAMNLSAYGGVYALNDDFKSRFRILPLGYPTTKEETTIVNAMVPGGDSGILDKVLTLAQHTRTDATNYSLSPRDVCDIMADTQLVGLAQALRLQSGKFEGEDRAAYVSWIKTTFSTEMLGKKVAAK